MADKIQHVVAPLPDCNPEIGTALWMLEDCRNRTRKALEGLNEVAVDRVDGLNGHSISTLLYHIAAIEISWLGEEVAEGGLPQSVWERFPVDVRDEQGRLSRIDGVSIAEHWQRLDFVRNLLVATYKSMSLEDYRRPRSFEKYDVTPEWVLHHLMQHEAEHRDEMISLRTAAK